MEAFENNKEKSTQIKKNLVFLDTEGITMTSANHICDMAKLYVSRLEDKVNEINLVNESIKVLNTGCEYKLKQGWTKDEIDKLPEYLDKIGKAKSLTAWLREGVKAKENITKIVSSYTIYEYLRDFNIELENPIQERVITDDDVISRLSVKERCRYYTLQAECANLGKIIHKDGSFAKAKKIQEEKINNPKTLDNETKELLIREYQPSVSPEDVDGMMIELQNRHREKQAEFNKIVYEIKNTVEKENQEVVIKYQNELNIFRQKYEEKTAEYTVFIKRIESAYRSLKIVIPNELKDIYEEINSL